MKKVDLGKDYYETLKRFASYLVEYFIFGNKNSNVYIDDFIRQNVNRCYYDKCRFKIATRDDYQYVLYMYEKRECITEGHVFHKPCLDKMIIDHIDVKTDIKT